MLVVSCGGSGSETPPPVEPTSAGALSDQKPDAPTANEATDVDSERKEGAGAVDSGGDDTSTDQEP